MTKRQLEDIVRCGKGEISCRECSNRNNRQIPARIFGKGTTMKDTGCIRKAAKVALAYRTMLERLEWKAASSENCPCCGASKIYEGEHKPDCELAALLKESEGLG